MNSNTRARALTSALQRSTQLTEWSFQTDGLLGARSTPGRKQRLRFHMATPAAVLAVGGWSVPFPTADRSVIARSQRHFLQHNKQRPVQLFTYVTFPYLLLALAVWVLGGLLLLAAKFEAGREFILKVI
uniref:Uncharacterized protein n=1 Tax=Timema cristinae TaxID=61476 RepID=A0A7R9DIM7_TIMCR|nr:unnamed protein product [Timema cristinae]